VDDVLDWLMAGDPAIRWQVQRDLLDQPWERERARVAREGWGAQLLSHRQPDGSWATGWYSPKWTSTFYSLQVLQALGVPAPESVHVLLDRFLVDGHFRPWHKPADDTCVTGMMLAMANEAGVPMPGAVDRLLEEQFPDGGWNCRGAARHYSLHTTISALEGLAALESDPAVREAAEAGREALLGRRLFRSRRTGEVIRPEFTRFSFPCYWHFDVLRALDYWRGYAFDDRLTDALDLVRGKARDGRWPLQNKHPGRTWFDMEQPGRPSRWNTLRALRVVKWAGG
jgi:hypothetical protein